MARVSRSTQKIFAGSATNNGIFGSAQAGTKILSNSLADIQSLGAWSAGWLDATIGALKFPPLEEMQAIQYLVTTQLAYLFQEGIAEYDAGSTYYHYSIVKNPNSFQLFGSLTDANIGNALPTAPASNSNWQFLVDLGNISPFSTGDAKLTMKTSADSGWVIVNDGTLGNAASGGTCRANADTINIFELLWTNYADAQCPVSGGRGGSAAADFAANKNIKLPLMLGRALAAAGAGAGLTSRALGFAVGDENLQAHTHTVTDTHQHAVNSQANFDIGYSGGNGAGFVGVATINATSGSFNFDTPVATIGSITINSAGTGSGGNMQPTGFAFNVMLKL